MINDEINERDINLVVRVSKITYDVVKKALEKLIAELEQGLNSVVKEPKEPELKHGKMTHEQLKRHNDGLTPLELTDPNLRLLHREMKRAKIDFAVEKDGKGKYVLFFKGKDADEMTRAFRKYTQKVIDRPDKKPSIGKLLAAAKEAAKAFEAGRNKVKNREMGARGR